MERRRKPCASCHACCFAPPPLGGIPARCCTRERLCGRVNAPLPSKEESDSYFGCFSSLIDAGTGGILSLEGAWLLSSVRSASALPSCGAQHANGIFAHVIVTSSGFRVKGRSAGSCEPIAIIASPSVERHERTGGASGQVAPLVPHLHSLLPQANAGGPNGLEGPVPGTLLCQAWSIPPTWTATPIAKRSDVADIRPASPAGNRIPASSGAAGSS